MQTFFTIAYYTLAIGALALGTLLVLMQTDMLPGYDVRIVQSGSMEPAIWTGSVVIIQDQDEYEVDDVVTFEHEGTTNDLPTTHRIIESQVRDGELVYITQGDANESADAEALRPEDIHGTVIFTIPYLGYILDFARQPLGFVLLIGVPAAFIVFEESSSIYQSLRGRREEDKLEDEDDNQDTDGDDIDTTPNPRHLATSDAPEATKTQQDANNP